MEPALRNGCRADFVVYAKSAPLPLAIIELKIGDELANKDCVADQLHAYSERMGASVEVFLALFPKTGQPFQLEGKQLRAVLKLVHHPLTANTGQFFVPSAVEIIAIPPPVGKMGEPCF